MSRIDTQSDRLVRGADEFQGRTNIAPVRVAPENKSAFSQMAQEAARATATVAGAVNRSRAREDEQNALLRKKEFNTAVSNLTKLESEWKSDPDNNGADYLDQLSAYESVFTEDTDEGVSIRRQFSTGPEVQAAERKQYAAAIEAQQGGILLTAKRLVETYNTDEQSAKYGTMNAVVAKAQIVEEMLSAYPDEVRDQISDETLFGIEEQAEEAVAFSRSIYKENKAYNEQVVADARFARISSNAAINGTVSVDEVLSFSKDTRTPVAEVINDLADNMLARLETTMITGSAEATVKQMDLLMSFSDQVSESPAVQADIQEKVVGAMAVFAANDAIAVSQIADGAVAQNLSKEDARMVMDNTGIDLYENSLGISVPDGVTRVEDIPVTNLLQKTYRDTIAKSVEEGVTRHQGGSDKIQSSVGVIFNPDQSSKADVTSTVNLEGRERVGFLNALTNALPEPDVNNPESLQLYSDMATLLELAKTDGAAYAEIMATQLDDSLHYGVGLKTFVTDNLDESTLSHEGIRRALAYTGSDLSTIARVVEGERDVYALSQTVRSVETGNVDDLATTYRQHLLDYDSVRFEANGATDAGVDLNNLMNTKKFRKDLLGTETAVLSPNQRKTLIGLLDVRSVDPQGRSDAVVPQFKQQLADKGYHVIAEETAGGSTVTSIVSYGNIPEAVPGLTKEAVTSGLNSKNSGMSRFIGTLLSPGGNEDLHDIALEVLREDPSVLKDGRFESVITEEQMFGMIQSGQATFHVLSRGADARGAPIMFRFSNGAGSIIRDVEIGRVNFNGPGFRDRGDSFFKAPEEKSSYSLRPTSGMGSSISVSNK